MKTIILIGILFLSLGGTELYSQKLQLPKKVRVNLDSIAQWTILKFGDKQYYNICKKNPDIKIDNEENRKRYLLTYHYDTTKIRLDYNYVAKVYIWCDTKKPDVIAFGNGWGYTQLEKALEDEKQGKKAIKKMPFQTFDYEELKRWNQEFEKFRQWEKRKLDSISKIYYKKLQREKDSLERKNN